MQRAHGAGTGEHYSVFFAIALPRAVAADEAHIHCQLKIDEFISVGGRLGPRFMLGVRAALAFEKTTLHGVLKTPHAAGLYRDNVGGPEWEGEGFIRVISHKFDAASRCIYSSIRRFIDRCECCRSRTLVLACGRDDDESETETNSTRNDLQHTNSRHPWCIFVMPISRKTYQ